MQWKIVSKDFNISTYENTKKLKKLTFSSDKKKEDNLKKNMINISQEKILGTKKKSYKFFLVSRMKKKDRFFLYPIYMKFLNRLMRKGYKNRYLTFFYKLLRAHKKRVFLYFNKNLEKKNTFKKVLPSFPLVFGIVFRFITLKVELKLRKIKKREVMTPAPMSPWRGWRTGLNILFINAKTRLDTIKRSRKVDFLYSILDEVWLTFQGNSATTKNIIEFTNNVLENSQNYRETELFPIRSDRQGLVSIKPLLKLKTNTAVFKQEKKKKKTNFNWISKCLKRRAKHTLLTNVNQICSILGKRERKIYLKTFFARKFVTRKVLGKYRRILRSRLRSLRSSFRKQRGLRKKQKRIITSSKINTLESLLTNKQFIKLPESKKSHILINKLKITNSKEVLSRRFSIKSFNKKKDINCNKLFLKSKNIYKYNYKTITNSVVYKYKKFLVYNDMYSRTNKRVIKLEEKERLKNV